MSLVRAPRVLLVGALAASLVALASAAPLLQAAVGRPPEVAMATVELPGGEARARAASSTTTVHLPFHADMVGASWIGRSQALELRAAGADGRWSGWVSLEAGEDRPDAGSAEDRAQAGRKVVAVPAWVGDADRVQVRPVGGSVRDVRIVALNVSGTATAAARASTRLRSVASKVLGAGDDRAGVATPGMGEAQAAPMLPGIHTRASWGARRSKGSAAYADAVRGVVIHHTDTKGTYACSQVPALLRGIQRYHMDSNGWNDIGYNLLVDRCGGVWEGREGGLTLPVIGAHTAGFNTGTAGVAFIGTHTALRPASAARAAVQRVIAWRLDLAHVNPTSTVSLIARSGDKYPVGSTVHVRGVSGHRDLYPTSCPGAAAYRDLAPFAAGAWRLGGVKVADVVATPSVDETTALTSHVSVSAVSNTAAATITLSVERISDGAVLATGATPGAAATLEWDAAAAGQAPVPVWDLRVRADARTAVQRARTALVPVRYTPPDPGFTVVTAPASSASLGGDPIDDALHLAYTLVTRARLAARVYDADGTRVATLRAPAYVEPTGVTGVPLDLTLPASLADGAYELRVGIEDDPAAGRSVDRFPLTITHG